MKMKTQQNLWDTAKAVGRSLLLWATNQNKTKQRDLKYIANDTSQAPRRIRQAKPKISRRKKMKIKAEINEMETKKQYKEPMN
jgi:hypothetical protein